MSTISPSLSKRTMNALSDSTDHASEMLACRTVFQVSGTQWLEPVLISAGTIAKAAAKPSTAAEVLDTLELLTEDDYSVFLRNYYRTGLSRFGSDWDYADLLTFLLAAARLVQPRNYLEIGVRRGRSLGVVASACPECRICGFDLWMADYAGMANPGPDFVADELKRVGFRGRLELISGDSHETVPQFLADNPALNFDLINVDGDHSEDGARSDLETVLPRLNVGGVLVMDDIVHPQHTYLEDIWDAVVGCDSNYTTAKYGELGYGVAVAVRKR